MNKLKTKKGFTLLEVTIAMALVGLLMLAVFKLIVFISDTLEQNAAEDRIQAACINLVEETRHTLLETHSLQCGTFNSQNTTGELSYYLSYTIAEARYPGAYKLTVSARTNQAMVFSREVILYAAE